MFNRASTRRSLAYPATDSAASEAPTVGDSFASMGDLGLGSMFNLRSSMDVSSVPTTPKSARSESSPRSIGSGRALSAVVQTDRKNWSQKIMTELTGAKMDARDGIIRQDVELLSKEIRKVVKIVNEEVSATTAAALEAAQQNPRMQPPPQQGPSIASMAEDALKLGLDAAAKVSGNDRVLRMLSEPFTALIFFMFHIFAVSFLGVVLAHLIRLFTGNVAIVSGVLSGLGGVIFSGVYNKRISRVIAWALAGIIIYHSDALEGTPHRELYDSIRENLGHHNVTMFHIAKGLADNRRCYASNFTLPSCGDVRINTGHLVSIFGEVFKGVLVHSDMMSGAASVNLSYQDRVISTKIHVLRGITLGDQVHRGYSFMSSLFGETPEDVTPPEIANLTAVDRQFLYLAYAELHAVRTAAERKRAMERAEGHKRLVNSARVFAGFMALVVRDPSLWSTVNFGSDFYQGAYTFYSNLFPSEHELVLPEGLDMCKVAACLGGTPDVAPPPPEPVVKIERVEVFKEVVKTVEIPKEVVVFKEVVKTVEVPKEVVVYKEVIKEVEIIKEVTKEVQAPYQPTWGSYLANAFTGVGITYIASTMTMFALYMYFGDPHVDPFLLQPSHRT